MFKLFFKPILIYTLPLSLSLGLYLAAPDLGEPLLYGTLAVYLPMVNEFLMLFQ